MMNADDFRNHFLPGTNKSDKDKEFDQAAASAALPFALNMYNAFIQEEKDADGFTGSERAIQAGHELYHKQTIEFFKILKIEILPWLDITNTDELHLIAEQHKIRVDVTRDYQDAASQGMPVSDWYFDNKLIMRSYYPECTNRYDSDKMVHELVFSQNIRKMV